MRSTMSRLVAAGAAGAVAVPAAAGAAATAPAAIELPVPGKHAVADPLHAVVKNRLVRRDVRLARQVERLGGDDVAPRYAKKLRGRSIAALRREERSLRREIRSLRAEARRAHQAGAPAGGAAVSPALAAIAQCESGGNPSAIGGGGAFRGKYQFTYSTWAAVGGSGDPAAAPEAEQDRRAAMLLATSGAGQGPVCGS